MKLLILYCLLVLVGAANLDFLNQNVLPHDLQSLKNLLNRACASQPEESDEIISKRCDLISRILEREPELSNSALLQASDLRIIRQLTEYGADPMAQIGNGRTAVHFAAFNQSFDILKFIEEAYGIDIRREPLDADGKTPFDLLWQVNQQRYLLGEDPIPVEDY